MVGIHVSVHNPFIICLSVHREGLRWSYLREDKLIEPYFDQKFFWWTTVWTGVHKLCRVKDAKKANDSFVVKTIGNQKDYNYGVYADFSRWWKTIYIV